MPLTRALPPVALVVALIAVLAGQGCASEAESGERHLSEAVNVYLVQVDGGAVRKVTAERGDVAAADEADDHEEEEGRAEAASFSPDGRRIAFSRSTCEYCAPELLTATTDGRRVERPAGPTEAFQPSWGRPGIVYLRLEDRGNALWLAGSGQRVPRRILLSSRSLAGPSWSADGRSLLVARQDTATNWDLYKLDAPGFTPRRLTRTAAQELAPAMATDGTLAFARQRDDGRWSVFIREPGSRPQVVPEAEHETLEPAISPDGTHLAFVRRHGDTASEIAVLDRRNGRIRALTDPDLYATGPRFSPDGRTIAFAARAVEGGAPPPHRH